MIIQNNNTLFISDLHLGHNNICKFRTRFKTLEEHDNTIKENLLKAANKRQKIFILGDIAFSEEAGDWIVELSKLCNLEIVLGNHDSSEGKHNTLKYVAAGIKVHGLLKYKEACLSHCPIHPDEMRKSKLNIHGHTHNYNIDDNRYFNVSCENVGYNPIRYDEILERTLSKEI